MTKLAELYNERIQFISFVDLVPEKNFHLIGWRL